MWRGEEISTAIAHFIAILIISYGPAEWQPTDAPLIKSGTTRGRRR